MKRKELLKALDKLFDKEERKLRKHKAELQKVLNQLDEKEARLSKKIHAENDPQKLERLEKKLAIIKAQRAKGQKALESIDTNLNAS